MSSPRQPPRLKAEQTAGGWLLREQDNPDGWIRAEEAVDAEL